MRHLATLIALIVTILIGSAHAWPVFSFVDEGQTITTTPGSIIRLEIETDVATSTFGANIRLNGNATFTDAINKSDCADYGWEPTLSSDPIYYIDPTRVQIYCANLTTPNSGPLVGYVEITYGSGHVIVSGSGFPPPPVHEFSTGVVTIVPEPATLLLLASGTLILLRKRRN